MAWPPAAVAPSVTVLGLGCVHCIAVPAGAACTLHSQVWRGVWHGVDPARVGCLLWHNGGGCADLTCVCAGCPCARDPRVSCVLQRFPASTSGQVSELRCALRLPVRHRLIGLRCTTLTGYHYHLACPCHGRASSAPISCLYFNTVFESSWHVQ